MVVLIDRMVEKLSICVVLFLLEKEPFTFIIHISNPSLTYYVTTSFQTSNQYFYMHAILPNLGCINFQQLFH